MKVNLFENGPRSIPFFLNLSFLIGLAALHCQASLVVDIPAQKYSQNYGLFSRGPHNSNSLFGGETGSIFKMANLSPSCSRDMKRFVDQITPVDNDDTVLENWALQMADAWAKIPEGVLSGHVNALGDFDECLDIRAPSKENHLVDQFQGKYCLVYVIPNVTISDTKSIESENKAVVQGGEKSIENLLKILSIVGNAELPLIPSVGTCLPSTCSDQEITEIVTQILLNFSLIPITTFCSVNEPIKFSTGAIVTMSLLICLVLLVFIGTLIDLATKYKFISTKFSSTKYYSIFLSFSLNSNGQKFLNTRTSPNDIGCLHGIRFLSASWVVLGHTYLMGIMQPLWNIVDTYTMITTSLSMVLVLNAAIVVDVFFVIGGFLVSLTLIVMLEKNKGKINLPFLYLHRYLRITPLYIIIILVGTFIFPLLGSGPYWHVAKTWAGYCERNWWKNVLYINNLPIYNTLEDPNDAPCHGMAWYLGVDMQLFLLSPFLLFPVWKWRKYGTIPLIILTIASGIFPGVLTYVNDYAPTSVPFGDRENRYSQEAYTPTYMRATPYLIGMCTGLLFNAIKNKPSFKLHKAIIIIGWILAFATGFSVLFSPKKFLNPEYNFKKTESAIYVSGHRTAWSIAISWLIFACGTGHGGWINQILSWRPFVPLGRLTFAIYLVSMHLQFLFHLQYRQPIYFSNYHMVNLYFAHLVMSCIVAVFCTLVVEAPFMQLLKLVMPTGKKQSKKITSSNQSNKNNQEI